MRGLSKLRLRGELVTPSDSAQVSVINVPDRSKRETRQLRRRLDDYEIATLVAEYLGGQTLRQLARLHQLHHHTVAEILERSGVPRRYRALGPEHIPVLVSMYRSGQSLARIGHHFGGDPGTVRRALLVAGIAMRDSHGRARRTAASEHRDD